MIGFKIFLCTYTIKISYSQYDQIAWCGPEPMILYIESHSNIYSTI